MRNNPANGTKSLSRDKRRMRTSDVTPIVCSGAVFSAVKMALPRIVKVVPVIGIEVVIGVRGTRVLEIGILGEELKDGSANRIN